MGRNMRADDAEGSFDALLENQLDITGAKLVSVQWREDNSVLWVNVNGVCVLRVCAIEKLKIEREVRDRSHLFG